MIQSQKGRLLLIAFPAVPKTLHSKCVAFALLLRMTMGLTLLAIIGSETSIIVFSVMASYYS